MLEKLALKDKYWRSVALKICRDKMLADDLTNDMYIALANNTKEINDFYVIVTIKNLFLQHIKQNKTTVLNDNYALPEVFELDDKEKNIIDNVYWVARDYMDLNQTMSTREIGKLLNTNYQYICKIIKNEKEKWAK